MTTELTMLVYTALLSILLAFPPLLSTVFTHGLVYAAGNRDEALPRPAWGARAERAQWNLLANLPAFAAVVLVAAIAGVSNEQTIWSAQLFFWARVAHAVIYVGGIPHVRALAFVASLSGLFGIASELL